MGRVLGHALRAAQRPRRRPRRPLRGALRLVEQTVEFGARSVSILRPLSAEELIDEGHFDRDEFLPYWAELWPSGIALAEVVAARDVRGLRVLELGCGLGLPSLAAALGGADVLATDWAEDAIELLRSNAERVGATLRAEVVRWDQPEPILRESPWDLVLAADLIYEQRNADLLADLLLRLGDETLLVQPERPYVAPFLERIRAERIAERLYRIRAT